MMYNTCQVETMWSQMPCPEPLSLLQCPKINYRQLAADQATSDEIHAYHTAITGLKLEDVPFQDFTALCDISTGYIWPIVPHERRRRIFDIIH